MKKKIIPKRKFNKKELKLELRFDEDTNTAYGEYRAPEHFEGAPDIVHTGIIASILDETMTIVNKNVNVDTFTNELTIRYLRPAFINENLYIRGWVEKKNNKIMENRAEIENDVGKIVARAKGKYLNIKEMPSLKK